MKYCCWQIYFRCVLWIIGQCNKVPCICTRLWTNVNL